MTEFFRWLSKTDPQAIELCTPVTRLSQTSFGVMILFTGLLAFCSGSYAIYVVWHSAFLAVVVGIIYSCMIVTFDREIVSATSKASVWLRVPLALLLGVVIAVPIELRILQDRIDQELLRKSHAENQSALDRRHSEETDFETRRRELERAVLKYQANVDEWGRAIEAEVVGRQIAGRTGKAGEGPAYRAAREQLDRNQELLTDSRRELEEVRKQETEIRTRAKQEFEQTSVAPVYDLLSRIEGLAAVTSQSSAAAAMSWSITALLVMIELFPALIKLLSPYSEYTAMVEARRREGIQRVHATANRHLTRIEAEPEAPVSIINALNNRRAAVGD